MKTIEERRAEMSKETWINNVMRVYGWERAQAEDAYNRIYAVTFDTEVEDGSTWELFAPTRIVVPSGDPDKYINTTIPFKVPDAEGNRRITVRYPTIEGLKTDIFDGDKLVSSEVKPWKNI